MLLTAPKRRPELTRSVKDIIAFIDNKPDNININAFYFTLGCVNCSHPELNESIETLQKKHPWLNIVYYHPNAEEDDNYHVHSDIVAEIFSTRAWRESYYILKKYFTVNYYFNKMANDALNNYPDTDLFITLEDDQYYNKNLLNMINDMVNKNKNNSVCYYKIAINKQKNFYGWDIGSKNGYYMGSYNRLPLWGNWGITRTYEQEQKFMRYVKFAQTYSCNDELAYLFCYIESRRIFVDSRISYHFGWDKIIEQ